MASINIYSKRVDYLYTKSFDVLNILKRGLDNNIEKEKETISQKERKESNSIINYNKISTINTKIDDIYVHDSFSSFEVSNFTKDSYFFY
jgi:hypothetical protein